MRIKAENKKAKIIAIISLLILLAFAALAMPIYHRIYDGDRISAQLTIDDKSTLNKYSAEKSDITCKHNGQSCDFSFEQNSDGKISLTTKAGESGDYIFTLKLSDMKQDIVIKITQYKWWQITKADYTLSINSNDSKCDYNIEYCGEYASHKAYGMIDCSDGIKLEM